MSDSLTDIERGLDMRPVYAAPRLNFRPLAHAIALAAEAKCLWWVAYYEGTDDPGCYWREGRERDKNYQVLGKAYWAIREAGGA